jgi:hypothetical protein
VRAPVALRPRGWLGIGLSCDCGITVDAPRGVRVWEFKEYP